MNTIIKKNTNLPIIKPFDGRVELFLAVRVSLAQALQYSHCLYVFPQTGDQTVHTGQGGGEGQQAGRQRGL